MADKPHAFGFKMPTCDAVGEAFRQGSVGAAPSAPQGGGQWLGGSKITMVSLTCLSSQLGQPHLGLGPPPCGLSLPTWHLTLQALLSSWTASTSQHGFQGGKSQDSQWLGQAPFQRVCFLWSGVQPGTRNFSLSRCFSGKWPRLRTSALPLLLQEQLIGQ